MSNSTIGTHPHGEHLSAYIDGMLDVARMRGIGEHLRGCSSCQDRTAQLRETKFLLRGMPEPSLPGSEFWTNAYRELRVSDRERAVTRRSFWETLGLTQPVPQRRWAAGLTAAVLLGALIAGPLAPVSHPLRMSLPLAVAAPDVSPDVLSLVESHTDSVSRLPLADPDRQKMIAADVQQSGETQSGENQQSGPNSPEAADYADATF